MNIEIFEDIILNTVLIVFPILVYLVLVCYKNDINKNYNNLLLSIALISSLYLCLRFGIIDGNSKVLLFCNIPIVIALMKKKSLLGVLLALINILYCFFIYKNICLIVTIKYLTYFILYLCARKRNLSTESFILSIAVLQGFFLSFEYFFKDLNLTLNSFIELIILVFIYYFISFVILYIFKIIEKVRELNKSIELLEKDKMIKESLFKLTHEIKNPIAVCKGYLDMMNPDDSKQVNKYVPIMKQEIDRTLTLMEDFLNLTRVNINIDEIDITLLLDDLCSNIEPFLTEKSVHFMFDVEDEEVFIKGDYDRLKQVFINLIKNSMESIPKDRIGIIKLRMIKKRKNIEIIIEDNGIGMNKETLNKIGEPFYTTKQKGTGLGVKLSKEIIELHKGTIKYSSILNTGTIVKVTLPIN